MIYSARAARIGVAALAITFTIGAAGCGPSAEEIQRAQAQAQRSQEAADRAQAAAAQAQKAAEAAAVEADRARKAVDDATREINRVSEHVDQINRERAATGHRRSRTPPSPPYYPGRDTP
jgi:uncharacterized protein HemX